MAVAVSIRPAAEADIPALREVYRRSSLSNEGDRALLTAHPELLEWAGASVADGRAHVAEADGAVVGFATLAFGGPTAELEDLFVDPDWMRQGIGRALVDALVLIARGAGFALVEVDANRHALAFYERAGFVAVGEVAVEYGTGIRMRRRT